MFIDAPSFGLVLMTRSQNFRRLFRPTPRSAAQENAVVMSGTGAHTAATRQIPIPRILSTFGV